MEIKIGNIQRQVPIDRARIKMVVKQILEHEGEGDAQLSILFVDDEQIKDLNYKYRGIRHPTDVLAFSMREGNYAEINPGLLGDVVISVQRAERQAKKRLCISHKGLRDEDKFKYLLEGEINLYLIHGILHLLGYDDTSAAGYKLMSKKQREILKNISHRAHREND